MILPDQNLRLKTVLWQGLKLKEQQLNKQPLVMLIQIHVIIETIVIFPYILFISY